MLPLLKGFSLFSGERERERERERELLDTVCHPTQGDFESKRGVHLKNKGSLDQQYDQGFS